jgi:hypothetical protein
MYRPATTDAVNQIVIAVVAVGSLSAMCKGCPR